MFFVILLGGGTRILAIELQGFLQRGAEIFQKFAAGFALAIHAGNFFNPAEPPAFILLDELR